MTHPLRTVSASERVPPQNIEAEKSLLGAMMLSREAIGDAIEIISADDFYKPLHGRIFEVVINLFGKGEPVDAITLNEELRRHGSIADLGGLSYLRSLSVDMPSTSNAAYYAEIVAKTATLRRLIETATAIADLAYDPSSDAEQILDYAESAVFQIGEKKNTSQLEHIKDMLDDTYIALDKLGANPGAITGIPTGYYDFDRMTAGLQPSNLIICAARPGMGKSTWVTNVAVQTALNTGPTAVFCLEMSKTEMVTRILSAQARVDQQKMKTGNLTETDWTRVSRSVGRLSESPLYIDDSSMLTVMEIRAKCRRLAAEKPLKLVIIDYMQLIQGSGRSDNRQLEVSDISRNLKMLAGELECPIICASQLNRSPEQRTDKRPMLGDLRESGSLEQDADLVLFLYRDDYYDKESPEAGEAELIIAKHRSGPTGVVRLAYFQHVSRFENLGYQENLQ